MFFISVPLTSCLVPSSVDKFRLSQCLQPYKYIYTYIHTHVHASVCVATYVRVSTCINMCNQILYLKQFVIIWSKYILLSLCLFVETFSFCIWYGSWRYITWSRKWRKNSNRCPSGFSFLSTITGHRIKTRFCPWMIHFMLMSKSCVMFY